MPPRPSNTPTRHDHPIRVRPAAYARIRRAADGAIAGRAYPDRMPRRPNPVIVLSALVIGAFELVGSFGAARNDDTGRLGMDAVAIALILIGPLALAVRDRWPLPALAVTLASASVYIGLGYVYGPIFVSVVVAMVYAVLRGRRRGTWILAALGFAGFAIADAVDDHSSGNRWLKLTLVAGWMIAVLGVAELVRSRRTIAHQRARAEAEERQRREGEQRLELAQELHDVLAHHISLINVQAGVALHLIDEQPERARPALTEIKAASREALRELRGALDVLRRGEAAPRSPAPTLADLDGLVAAVRASGLDVRLDVAVPTEPLPAAVELAAFRIVQEALTNVSRHAAATAATVVVRAVDDLTVEVVDDGAGAPGAVAAGNGIAGMRERATALGGDLDAGPLPGRGFRVAARLPIAERVGS